MVESARTASVCIEPASSLVDTGGQAIADGEPSGRRFERICTPLRADLYRFAVWLTRDRALADDVVQEALLRAWNNLDSLQDERAARPWLLKIVRREAARAYDRKRHPTSNIDELIEANDPALAAPESLDVADVRRAIFDLDDDYREPLVLQVLRGFTTAEIAAITGINQATVLTRLFRGRNRLRAALGANFD